MNMLSVEQWFSARTHRGPLRLSRVGAHDCLNHKTFFGLILHLFQIRKKRMQFWFKTIYAGKGP